MSLAKTRTQIENFEQKGAEVAEIEFGWLGTESKAPAELGLVVDAKAIVKKMRRDRQENDRLNYNIVSVISSVALPSIPAAVPIGISPPSTSLRALLRRHALKQSIPGVDHGRKR